MKKVCFYEEGGKRRGLSFVDWVLLFAVFSILFAIGAYVFYQKTKAQPTQSIRYTICVSGAPTVVAEVNGSWEHLIPMGASVTTQNGTAELGRVVSLSFRPSVVAGVADGELIWIEAVDTVDLLIDVEGEGVARYGDGLRIQDVRIAAGDTGSFRIGGYYAPRASIVFAESESLK